jgi:hypothetical protein
MAPPYFYTTERRLAHRSLTHKGLTISYRHPCALYWRLMHSIPLRRIPMNRRTVLVGRKAHAVTSLVRHADGASPGHSWLAVVATKTCAYGTCGLGVSFLPLSILVTMILIRERAWWIVSHCTSFVDTPRQCAASK